MSENYVASCPHCGRGLEEDQTEGCTSDDCPGNPYRCENCEAGHSAEFSRLCPACSEQAESGDLVWPPETEEHHYYVTWSLGWATAPTLDEAVKRLARGFQCNIRESLKNQQKNGKPGLYIWACRVPGDYQTTCYAIDFYKPVGVEISDTRHLCLVKATTKQVLWAEMPREFL